MQNQSKKIDEALYNKATDLLLQGQPASYIETELKKISDDFDLILDVIHKATKDYYANRRKVGLIKISIGVVLILLGFVITCFNFYSNKSFSLAMYGLTSFGIFFLFWGLYVLIG
jgi:hypothetical protein